MLKLKKGLGSSRTVSLLLAGAFFFSLAFARPARAMDMGEAQTDLHGLESFGGLSELLALADLSNPDLQKLIKDLRVNPDSAELLTALADLLNSSADVDNEEQLTDTPMVNAEDECEKEPDAPEAIAQDDAQNTPDENNEEPQKQVEEDDAQNPPVKAMDIPIMQSADEEPQKQAAEEESSELPEDVEQKPEQTEPKQTEPEQTEPEHKEAGASEPEQTELEGPKLSNHSLNLADLFPAINEAAQNTDVQADKQADDKKDEDKQPANKDENKQPADKNEDKQSADKDKDKQPADKDEDKKEECDNQRYIVSLQIAEGATVNIIESGKELSENCYSVLAGKSFIFNIDLSGDYLQEDLVVKANGQKLDAKSGVYIINDIRQDIIIEIELKQVYREFDLYDDNTRVRVRGMSIGTPKLSVKKLGSSSSAYKKLLNAADGKAIAAYDISLSGRTKGSFAVSFRLGKEYEGQTITILHRKGSGKIEADKAVVKNSRVSISVSDLSSFMLVQKQKSQDSNTQGEVESPRSGDNKGHNNGFALIALSLILTAFCISKKRRQKTK